MTGISNKRITKNSNVKAPYIQAVLAEWKKYISLFNSTPKIACIHLGGGTPTFFDPSHLTNLISTLLTDAQISTNAEFSFEGHPNNTSLAIFVLLERIPSGPIVITRRNK